MLKPFADSARALATGPLTWRTWAGLIAVPLVICGLLTWAFWSPGSDHGTATAAVVNLDEPVTVNGQLLPLGRQLAGDLTHSADSAYRWVLTDAGDAASGLADGSYTAVVTIPRDFSAHATSAATAKPLEATQARIQVTTSDAAGVADPALAGYLAEATQRTLDRQIVETYLDRIYVGFTTLHEQVGQAADGAAQLADGTAQLAPGAKKLADGSAQLSAAAQQLAAGAGRLADGTGQLAAGSGRLASGLTQAQRDTAQLPALTRQLANGAGQVADGNEQLAAAVVPLANRIIAAIDALPSARDAAEEFRRLAGRCSGTPPFCDDLRQAADRFAADAGKIDGAKATVRANAVRVRDSVQALATGARRVADGNAQLASKSGALAAGIADAAAGARRLDSGVRQADTGARALATGSGQLAAGAKELATGAGQLNDGAGRVNDGAHELATQLDKGRDQVPSYTDAERAHLKTVAADPSTATTAGTATGPLALTLFAALALWALALATYLVTQAVPAAVLTAREPTWRIILRAALPGAAAATLAALAITAVAVPVLKPGFAGSVAFLVVALLAAAAFVALNQAATALFGRAGRLASLVVLVLATATGVVSTLPGPLAAVAGYLPTHGAVIALRAAATGGDGLASGVAELAAWLVVGMVASILVTDRRRYLSAKQVRVSFA
ncbi:putative membrane protein [Amycolatopsis tolypomycina]|uniref:Putative membrane protein n=1 Tax=Amycolatopsis tolypomycina TaxID=208445 RepID=A0A1H4SNJ8_9PSEU|nr:YhgE/Pip family protein [Amycolatopsis tolypomycina]SEC45712.1 putative membrane protein [Amycolatopsis tolypomycina]